MAAVCGMTVVKKFTYRGNAGEEWSNQYWFTGAVPANDTDWTALFNALVAQEKTCYSSVTSVVRGYGYGTDVDTDPAVWVHDISASPVAGTLATTSSDRMPGDTAVWVRWKTSRLNSRGKAIYLRKYFHDAYSPIGGDRDDVLAGQITALTAFGTKLRDASFLDARTIRSMHHAETIVSSSCSTWLTTRTLKRRGKRPSS